jgi:hypothetical protein
MDKLLFWLGIGAAQKSAGSKPARLGDGTLTFPPPSDAIKAWPLIGEKIYESWLLASTNLRALVIEAATNYCSRYRPAARQPQEVDLGAGHLSFRTILNRPKGGAP